MDRFKDKVVLITGSTRGIGRAIAFEFAKEGAKIILNYRKKRDKAEETLKEIKKITNDVILIKADVSNRNDVNKMFNEIENIFNGIDILINNAGLGIAYPFIEYPDDLWERIININLNSVAWCSKKAAKYMIKKRWGRIINITSVAGIIGMMNLAPYSAAKAGLIGLTKTLAIELAPYNITVNAIAAGIVRTKLGMSIFKLVAQNTKADINDIARKWANKHTLIGRLLEPYEIARLVLFLADEESSGITGQLFIIDGGQTLIEGKI